MNKISHNLSLDVNESSSQCCISAKKGDTSRKLVISLSNNGQPYIISGECYAVFSAIKSDGSIIYHDCVVQNNTIVYEYQDVVTSTEGRVDCEVILFGGDSQRLFSPRFAIMVHATVFSDEETESSEEITSLVSLISKSNDAIIGANDATENANTAAENANTAAENANTNAVKKTGDTMTGQLTVNFSGGEAFRARRTVAFNNGSATKRLYSGIKVDGSNLVGHIQTVQENASGGGIGATTVGLLFKDDGLYQNLGGVETKLGGGGGLSINSDSVQVEEMEFYEGYGTTLTYRLLDFGFQGSLLDTNSTYLAEFVICGKLQVDSGSAEYFEAKITGILANGGFTQLQGYQKNIQMQFEYFGDDERVYDLSPNNVYYSSEDFQFWVDLKNIYNADQCYDGNLETFYSKASFLKLS